MRFTIEKSEIDFGYTPIDNIFIEDYLPVANGEYIKVYIYTYKKLQSDMADRLSDEIIARNLGITVADVTNAWDYWADEGIIEIHEGIDNSTNIEFKNIKKLYTERLQNVQVPKRNPTDTLIDVFTNNDRVREMFSTVDYEMRRQTTPVEKQEILSWISQYNLSPEIIELGFNYSASIKKKISVAYVRSVITSWYDKGLSSVEEIEKSLEAGNQKYVKKNYVLSKLGLPFRTVSDKEIEIINSWYDGTLPDQVIDEALDRTSGIERPSINYAHSIIRRWKELGVKTYEDIDKLDVRYKRSPSRKNKFHNYENITKGMSVEELDKIAENVTKRRNK